jgi:GR25 family glycosyltransferase involved in LPS biosynthesis
MDKIGVAPPLSPKRRMITESYVISFNVDHVNEFIQRINGSQSVLWVPGVDGFHQRVLDTWAKLSGQFPVINASHFDPNRGEDRGKYRSPHAVGCYLAHWHLLKSLHHREPEMQPDLYFVFEDDASCVPDVVNRTLEVMSILPPDWDMFFIAGKPFTYFPLGNSSTFNGTTLRRDICQGIHGKGDSPLAPDGTRQLSLDDPYWQIKYITNTHAYVVNPQRVGQVLNILKPQANEPVDIRLADAMYRGDLNVYMPTQQWCFGDARLNSIPKPWWGFYHIPGVGYEYQSQMLLDNCTY